MKTSTSVMGRVRAAVTGSRWVGLLGKAGAYGAMLAALSLIGSGRFSAWLSPPAKLSIGIATAAAATPPPTVSASAAEPPRAGDAGAPAEGAVAEVGDGGAGSAGFVDGKVILNLATEADLRRLPGVGATRAKAILALRARMKKFNRVEDLLKVKGFGRRTLARLRPLVRVD